MTHEEILQKAIDTHGCVAQIDMLHEEIGELMQAINKIKRLGGISMFYVNKPNEQTETKYSIAYYNLCSEVADVKIMLSQMENMLDKQAIDIAYERKIARLEERLK